MRRVILGAWVSRGRGGERDVITTNLDCMRRMALGRAYGELQSILNTYDRAEWEDRSEEEGSTPEQIEEFISAAISGIGELIGGVP